MGGTSKKTNQGGVLMGGGECAGVVTGYGYIQSWLNGTQMIE